MGTIEASQKPRGKLYSPVAGLLLVFIFPNFPATADTLEWALVQAYQNNPSLNAQRAALRATDENVPQALSGYRPKLSVTSTDGFAYSSTLSNSVNQQVFPNTVTYSNLAK
ncbi:MAG: TolC family protein, partial [Xanthobacteraceae bacterium]